MRDIPNLAPIPPWRAAGAFYRPLWRDLFNFCRLTPLELKVPCLVLMYVVYLSFRIG